MLSVMRQKRFVIFANGQADSTARDYISASDTIICADGGAIHALELGLTPDLVIGDLDSLDDAVVQDLQKREISIQRHPVNKDKTDLELALDYVVQQHGTHVLLLTAFGGRVDQMIGNLLVFTLPSFQKLDATIIDRNHKIHVIAEPCTKTFHGAARDTFSILPLSPLLHIDTLKGTEWPLDNTELHMGSSHGMSNKFVQPDVILTISNGSCLVIHTCNQ